MPGASGTTSAGVSRRAFVVALVLSVSVHALFLLACFNKHSSAVVSVPPCERRIGDEKRFSTIQFEPSSARRHNSGQDVDSDQWLRKVYVAPAPVASAVASAGQGPQVVGERPGGHPNTGSPGGGGNGHGSCFFGQGIDAKSVVYVIDRSLSMGPTGALARARAELLASLQSLRPGVKFQVIFYTLSPEPLALGTRDAMLDATPDTIQRVATLLDGIRSEGGTDHVKALKLALAFRPDLIFLVTDADDLTMAQVETISRHNRSHTTIQAIDVGNNPRAMSILQALAEANHGGYQRVAGLP